jgi:hypothetical protein
VRRSAARRSNIRTPRTPANSYVEQSTDRPAHHYPWLVPDASSPTSAQRPPDASGGARPTDRAKDRRTAAPLVKVGMIAFAVGLVAVFADMILFAAGSRNLPLWVNLLAMLAPVGLALGLIGVVRENRSSSPALAARRAAADRR